MSISSFYDDDATASRPKTADGGVQRPAMLKRPTLGSRNVSFTPGVQPHPPAERPSMGSRNVSFTPGVQPFPLAQRPEPHRFNSEYGTPEPQQNNWTGEAQMQRIDRHAQNVDPDLEPALPFTRTTRDSPFAVYDESFAQLLGKGATLERILSDSRSPFFYNGGAYVTGMSTCFLTSNLLQDLDPWAVSQGNRRVDITKLEFYGAKVIRDKVRCPDRSYMAAGAAVHPSSESPSIIFCTQGTLHEAAGLVCIEARRPHTARMILNNFHGKPFNSPSEIVSNPVDKAVYFTDPAYGYKRGFRPKPQLPSGHIYRFHPATGDCRVVASDLKRPSGLAFSPDYSTLYVSELIEGHDGVYIHAYDITYSDPAKAPSFNISVVPSIKHTASGSSGSNNSGSSPRSPRPYHRGQGYPTPDSSPQSRPATLLGASSSHSRSASQSRAHEMSNHKFLHNMTNGLRSNPRGPTSEPTLMEPPSPVDRSFHSSERKRGTFLSSKRLVVYTPNAVPSGTITTDPIHGDLWLGTEEGVEVWNAGTGELTGKILIEEWDARRADDNSRKMRGISKVVFTNDGEALLLGGERIWRLKMGHRGLHAM